MFRTLRAAAVLPLFLVGAGPLTAPALRSGTPHTIVIRMVVKGGTEFRFDPAALTVSPGDTLRFVQASDLPHDVDLQKAPRGAHIGHGELVPLLISKGQTFDLVIDQRFVPGVYHFVCEPHAALGMIFTLTVSTGGTS